MPYPAQTNYATIIATAWTLIEQVGVEQLGLVELASALGIKAPSLYRYVPNKAALLQGVIALTFEQLFAVYARAVQTAGADPKAQVLAQMRAHRAFAHANPQTYMLAFTTTAHEQRPDQGVLEQMVLPIQAVMAALSGAEHALAALRGALALVHGFVMLELKAQFQRGGDVDAAFEMAMHAYLVGLMAVDVTSIKHVPSANS